MYHFLFFFIFKEVLGYDSDREVRRPFWGFKLANCKRKIFSLATRGLYWVVDTKLVWNSFDAFFFDIFLLTDKGNFWALRSQPSDFFGVLF